MAKFELNPPNRIPIPIVLAYTRKCGRESAGARAGGGRGGGQNGTHPPDMAAEMTMYATSCVRPAMAPLTIVQATDAKVYYGRGYACPSGKGKGAAI